LTRGLGSSLRRADVGRVRCLLNPAFAASSCASITTRVSSARRKVAAIVALRVTTASDGVVAIWHAPDFELDVDDFPDFVTRTFARDATRVAAGFRAGLAVRVTPMNVEKLPRGGPDTAEFLDLFWL
jgi:hypothetical protein